MSRNINVGVIGCELSEDLFQLNNASRQENLQVKKVFSDENASGIRSFPGMEVVQDVKAILYDTDIELVIISNNHLSLVREAVAAGKSVRVAN